MNIQVSKQGPITVISINRPHVRNAVDFETAAALFEAFLEFEHDSSAAVSILTGDKSAFCAGYDLKYAAQGLSKQWMERHQIPANWTDPVKQPLPSPMGPARLRLSKPVLAAVEGAAVAGGLELALWCDVRIAAASAYFGVYCRRWGVPLIDGGTIRLPTLIGQGRANDLILSGRSVSAAEALQIGLINQCCTEGAALDCALKYAENLLAFPQACLGADHDAARPDPAELAAALKREWKNVRVFFETGIRGAAKFSTTRRATDKLALE